MIKRNSNSRKRSMFSFGINRNSTASITRYSHARKAVYTKRLRYYWDESHYEAAELIAKRFSRPEQFRIFSINIVRAIADKRASTYRLRPAAPSPASIRLPAMRSTSP